MKTLFTLTIMAVLFITSTGCKKCTDAELAAKINTLNNQETAELQNSSLTSSQITAIEAKYNRYRASAQNDCK